MKEAWKECKLGEVVEINPTESIKKGTISKKIGMDLLQPFCRSISSFSTEAYSGGAKFRNKDTIMARITPCLENGKTAMVNILDDNEIGFGSTEYIVFRAKNNISDPYFIYYLITSSLIREPAIKSMVGSSGRQRVQTDVVANLSINLPPLATQQKIAKILSSLDDKIELNNKINDNLEQQAQAIYDELFNNDDRTIILGDIIETTSGGTPSRKNMAFYTNGNYCWVKSKELQSSFIIDTEEKITDDAINNSAAKLLPKNSVLIAMYGATVGAYGIISKDMTCNQAICALLPNENYPYSYLFMFAKNITHELENLAVGSAQQNISQVLIKKLKVHSDTNKIKEFHSYTHSLFEKKLLIEQENKNLSNLRDTLLPKLMSGET